MNPTRRMSRPVPASLGRAQDSRQVDSGQVFTYRGSQALIAARIDRLQRDERGHLFS